MKMKQCRAYRIPPFERSIAKRGVYVIRIIGARKNCHKIHSISSEMFFFTPHISILIILTKYIMFHIAYLPLFLWKHNIYRFPLFSEAKPHVPALSHI